MGRVICDFVSLQIKDPQLGPVHVIVALDTMNHVLREIDLLEMYVPCERCISDEPVMSSVK